MKRIIGGIVVGFFVGAVYATREEGHSFTEGYFRGILREKRRQESLPERALLDITREAISPETGGRVLLIAYRIPEVLRYDEQLTEKIRELLSDFMDNEAAAVQPTPASD